MVQETVNHFLNRGSNPIIVALEMTMALDMCHFDILFTKIETKLYERQYTWVRWGTSKSPEFGIKNGTRQALVLFPALFIVYIQELLDTHQELGTGCHIGATFLGAMALADKVLLTAPTRGSMQPMRSMDLLFKEQVQLGWEPMYVTLGYWLYSRLNPTPQGQEKLHLGCEPMSVT